MLASVCACVCVSEYVGLCECGYFCFAAPVYELTTLRMSLEYSRLLTSLWASTKACCSARLEFEGKRGKRCKVV